MKRRYIDNGDGTVTDNATGLMWTKNAYHGAMTWSEAVAYCDNLVTNGYSDWRLPSVAQIGGTAELDTLCRANGNPAGAWEGHVGTPFTGMRDGICFYWSGTSHADHADHAWIVAMSNGDMGFSMKTYNHFYVWPVRGGQ
jgi:hypothetical protein